VEAVVDALVAPEERLHDGRGLGGGGSQSDPSSSHAGDDVVGLTTALLATGKTFKNSVIPNVTLARPPCARFERISRPTLFPPKRRGKVVVFVPASLHRRPQVAWRTSAADGRPSCSW
jgi:hypothetical protein